MKSWWIIIVALFFSRLGSCRGGASALSFVGWNPRKFQGKSDWTEGGFGGRRFCGLGKLQTCGRFPEKSTKLHPSQTFEGCFRTSRDSRLFQCMEDGSYRGWNRNRNFVAKSWVIGQCLFAGWISSCRIDGQGTYFEDFGCLWFWFFKQSFWFLPGIQRGRFAWIPLHVKHALFWGSGGTGRIRIP